MASCRMPRGSFKRRGFCLGRSFCGGHGHSRQSPGACFRFPYRILSCGVSAVLRDQGLLQAHLGSQGRTAQGAKGALSRRAFRFCPLKGCPKCLLMLSPWFALGPAEGSLAKWHSQHDCVQSWYLRMPAWGCLRNRKCPLSCFRYLNARYYDICPELSGLVKSRQCIGAPIWAIIEA